MTDLLVLINGMRQPYTKEGVEQQFGKKASAMILEATKYTAIESVKFEHGNLLVKLTGDPTNEEYRTWERQRDWAMRCLDGDPSADGLLIGMATKAEKKKHGKGLAKYIATVIIEKNNKAEYSMSVAGGIRRTALEAIYAAKTIDDIENALSEVRNSAEAAIKQVSSDQS